MQEKDWVQFLTKEFITMELDNVTGEQKFIPCRAELASPTTDWSSSWQACRQPGVPPDLASFLWRMLLNLLPTQAKLHRMGTIRSPQCKMQGCTEVGTLEHELISCSKNEGVGLRLVDCLQQYIPGLRSEDVLHLEHGHVDDELSLASTLLIATILSSLWKER